MNVEQKTEKKKDQKNVKMLHACATMEAANGEDDEGEEHHG